METDSTNLLVFTQKVDKDAPILGFFHEWVHAFARKFNKVIVVCLEEGEHNLPANVTVRSLGKEDGESRLKYIKNFYRYIFSCKNEYDAVLVHMNQEYLYLGGLLWRLWGKKVLWWKAHGHLSLDAKLATIIPHEILTSSQEGFRFETSKKNIVGQGIDTNLFSPSDTSSGERLELLCVGRIAPVKHIEELIDLVAELKEAGIEAKAQIAGPVKDKDTEYGNRMRQKVESKDLQTEIDFLGSVPQADMPDLYRKADILVNTSDTDSLDKVVFEAMASGTIPVTSNDAFRPVLSEHDLFVPKRDMQALVDTILRVRNMEEKQRAELKRKLREYVEENHSLNSLAQHVYEYARK